MKQLAYLYPQKGLIMQDVPEPQISTPTGVKIKLEYCAICGSDLHISSGAFDYMMEGMPENYPMPLGHEASGYVTAVGEGCTTVKVGDRVTYNNNKSCGKCYFCRNGLENLCPFPAGVLGGMGEYIVVDETQIYHLPEQISLKQGCLTEPVSIAMRAIQKADIKPGQSVAIVGGGPIGVLVLQLARLSGAYPIALLDVIPEKLEIAKRLGADHTFHSNDENIIEQVKRSNEGRGYDVVIECSGAIAALDTAYKIAAPGATLVIASVYRGGAKYELDMFTVYNRELTIKSAVLSPGLFDRSVRILNRINFAETITAEYTLDQYEEAFAAHKSGKNMKIVLKIDPESPDC